MNPENEIVFGKPSRRVIPDKIIFRNNIVFNSGVLSKMEKYGKQLHSIMNLTVIQDQLADFLRLSRPMH